MQQQFTVNIKVAVSITFKVKNFILIREIGCPNGWKKGEQDECLLYVGYFPYTFDQAVELCRIDFEAHLLTIHNEVKQLFIEKWIKHDQIAGYIWLDAMRINCANSKSSFIWRNGSDIVYAKFASNEPNNDKDNEYCLHINHLGIGQTWNDVNCDRTSYRNINFNAICEKSCY